MNKFDDYIKEKAKEESIEVPENVSKAVENALASLPETNKSASKIKIFPKILSTAACVVFFFLGAYAEFQQGLCKITCRRACYRQDSQGCYNQKLFLF